MSASPIQSSPATLTSIRLGAGDFSQENPDVKILYRVAPHDRSQEIVIWRTHLCIFVEGACTCESHFDTYISMYPNIFDEYGSEEEFPRRLVVTSFSLSLGSAREVLYSILARSVFGSFLLPTVIPSHLEKCKDQPHPGWIQYELPTISNKPLEEQPDFKRAKVASGKAPKKLPHDDR